MFGCELSLYELGTPPHARWPDLWFVFWRPLTTAAADAMMPAAAAATDDGPAAAAATDFNMLGLPYNNNVTNETFDAEAMPRQVNRFCSCCFVRITTHEHT